jgi:hypothetical protein
MIKGDAVVLVNEDGTKDDNGFYFVEQFETDDGELIMVVGGAEELMCWPANRIEAKTSTDQQNTMNVLVDIAGSVKYLTERINLLIPSCPDCGEDLHCGPMPDDDEDEETEPNLN